MNPRQRLALYGGKPIPLSAKEFDILCYMVQRGTGIISSEEIAEHIYDEFYNPFSSVLRVHIANLRRKLKEASGRDLLVTWKGKGYQICVLCKPTDPVDDFCFSDFSFLPEAFCFKEFWGLLY